MSLEVENLLALKKLKILSKKITRTFPCNLERMTGAQVYAVIKNKTINLSFKRNEIKSERVAK